VTDIGQDLHVGKRLGQSVLVRIHVQERILVVGQLPVGGSLKARKGERLANAPEVDVSNAVPTRAVK